MITLAPSRCFSLVSRLPLMPLATALCVLIAYPALGQTDLSDSPPQSTISVPDNLLLVLSVEYPTALSRAHRSDYSDQVPFIGYFDPNKCYQYHRDFAVEANNYFEPIGGTHDGYRCKKAWSGNFLNWASSPTIDPFRWALTGGHRSIDTTTMTVLEKATANNQAGPINFPIQSLSDSDLIKGATPTRWKNFDVRMYGMGLRMRFSGGADVTDDTLAAADGSVGHLKADAVYDLTVRVRVCNPEAGLEPNCTAYGTAPVVYKPTGLIQAYEKKLRYGAFGFLLDNNLQRDGGVLRAKMKSVGPSKLIMGSPSIPNLNREWDPDTGIFIPNPDASDAAKSNVSKSGVINYVNQFGQSSNQYKVFDPVSELYYAAIRYLKGQGFVAAYGDASVPDAMKDGFPVITFPTFDEANDPVQYACQKNFILGIGDQNNHADTNLPGSKLSKSLEPSVPPEVSADTTVDTSVMTDRVGALEGIANLGTTFVPWCCNNSGYLMAGLAYDSHVNDMRPNSFGGPGPKPFITTVSTFWVDVMEYNVFHPQNKFWLAAKYGGFTIPPNYKTENTIPLPVGAWNATGARDPADNLKPDNYFDGGSADKMVTSLTSAFKSIIGQGGSSAVLTLTSPVSKTSIDTANYSSSYDTATWTGNLTGSKLTIATDGSPTLNKLWEANQVLDTQAAGSHWREARHIATRNSAGSGPGVPFTAANLSAVNIGALGGAPAAAIVDFLRGDRSNEGSAGTAQFRSRKYLLGDIIGSKPAAVPKPSATYFEDFNPGYTAFKEKLAGRPNTVYVGANDGMMHAFNGEITGAAGGTEFFAYVPSFLYSGPTATPAQNGLASLAVGPGQYQHHPFVDATPVITDVDFSGSDQSGQGTNWRSLLVGGLGKGGKGYFAIDVTDPRLMNSDAAVAEKVLWEFTDPTMGYSYGPANVLKTKKYGWVVILTSGYNNADGHGYFYIVDPATGKLLESIVTVDTNGVKVGTPTQPSGLTHATSHVVDVGDFTADATYAGDLLGNIWRLDLTATNSPFSVQQIAVLTDSSGRRQPVTTRPLTESDSNSDKRYIMIGTGRLLGSSDISSTQPQSFYAIVDGTRSVFDTVSTLPTGRYPITRADLNNDGNLLVGIGSAPANPLGWYHDFAVVTPIAERVLTTPTFADGIVAFSADLPSGAVCTPSGTYHLFATALTTGKSLLLDTVGISQGFISGTGLSAEVSLVSVNGKLRLYGSGSDGSLLQAPGNFTTANTFRRLNWRDIPMTE